MTLANREKTLIYMIYQKALLIYTLLISSQSIACPSLDGIIGNWSATTGMLTAGNAGHQYELLNIIFVVEKNLSGLYKFSSCEGTGAIDARWLCHSGHIFSESGFLYATNGDINKKVKIGTCSDSDIAMHIDNTSGGWKGAIMDEHSWDIKISASRLDLIFNLKRENLPYKIEAAVYR